MKKSKNYVKIEKIKKTKGTPHAISEFFEFFTSILILILLNEYINFSLAKNMKKCMYEKF